MGLANPYPIPSKFQTLPWTKSFWNPLQNNVILLLCQLPLQLLFRSLLINKSRMLKPLYSKLFFLQWHLSLYIVTLFEIENKGNINQLVTSSSPSALMTFVSSSKLVSRHLLNRQLFSNRLNQKYLLLDKIILRDHERDEVLASSSWCFLLGAMSRSVEGLLSLIK